MASSTLNQNGSNGFFDGSDAPFTRPLRLESSTPNSDSFYRTCLGFVRTYYISASPTG
jgi:hypothetical protein